MSQSIIIPVYGFSTPAQFAAYQAALERPSSVTATTNQKEHIRNPNTSFTLTTEMLPRPNRGRQTNEPTRPQFETLRKPTKQMPAGAYNAMLLLGGKMKVSYPILGKKTYNRELESISFADRDCFVAWRRYDGSSLGEPGVTVKGLGDNNETRQAWSARSGRCVIYARRLHVYADPFDRICYRHQTWVMRLEFSILDSQPAKGDVLRFFAEGLKIDNIFGEGYEDPPCDHFDASWHELLHEAREGFMHQCVDVTPELTVRYDAVLEDARKRKQEIDASRARERQTSGYFSPGGHRRW